MLETGTIIAERYRIEKQLGEGGMGAVYLVTHVHMQKKLALKVLRAEMLEKPEVLARFEREAMAAANVNHPNVVAATDFGRTADGAFFLVLELVEGPSLADALAKGKMVPARALGIARQIASALVRAHSLGIVHRDLKPDNVVLVDRDGEADFVKVLDFGIAKVPVESMGGQPGQVLTQLGTVFGTPAYMSPEQAMGEEVGPSGNLYSLGVILYEMVTGAPPFVSDDFVVLLTNHVTMAPPPMTDAPPAIAALTLKLLAKAPEDRPADARAVVAAIDAIDEPPPSSWTPADSVAKTNLPMSVPLALRLRGAALAAHARVKAIHPRAPLAIAIAVGLAFAGLLIIAIVPRRAHPESIASADQSGSSARSDGSHERAKKEIADLVLDHRYVEAMTALGSLLREEPNARSDPRMREAVTTAVLDPVAQDSATALLEGPFGDVGVDILMELSAKPGPTGKRFTQSLAKPEVRAHASPAAGIALDLRAAKKCSDRHDLLARAKATGDGRTLEILKPMQKKSGCGFLGVKDCWSCMRDDDDLDGTIAAITERVH